MLHADGTTHKARHYLGLTTPAGFIKRMRRHAFGTGSHITSRWRAERATVFVAGVIPAYRPGVERDLKTRGHFATWCPVCTNAAVAPRLDDVAGVNRGDGTTGQPMLDWRSLARSKGGRTVSR